ncbi:hypothetical protein [Corynebacterium aquilae]|uniref:Uncharacterized protein n=1 Tax=Corynebacterium aquilae DSM 44791 TaxID=1431546 RepID=A0A1L7CHK8_9CORY|nr:hypothetical protein [Corynebacterium aquilae]APT85346.1 hypothetical protein CAQU_10070 [Corynebacterium aquilae DSM 44791]
MQATSPITLREKVFCAIWFSGHSLAIFSAAGQSLFTASSWWEKLCAALAALVTGFMLIRYGSAARTTPASTLLKDSYDALFIAYFLWAISWRDGGLSLVALAIPFIIYLAFVGNDRFIHWLNTGEKN